MSIPKAGAKVRAADLAGIFQNDTDGWPNYVPTWTQSGTVTATVNYCRYNKVGREVTYQGYLTATGAGTAGNALLVTLPVAANVIFANGSFLFFDASAGQFYAGTALTNSSTTLKFVSAASSITNYLGIAGGGFTLAVAAGDILSWSIKYESTS